MKEGVFALFAVVVISAVALGVLVSPHGTGAVSTQYSPAQYAYATPLKQCMIPFACRMADERCPSGSALFVDGSKVTCATESRTSWCEHYKIGWNGGSKCDRRDPNVVTQCVCV